MTRDEMKANASRNRRALHEWWVPQRDAVRLNRRRVLLVWSTHTAYFAEHYERWVGRRLLRIRYFCSVDLRQPTIFTPAGKLRVRLLRERFAK